MNMSSDTSSCSTTKTVTVTKDATPAISQNSSSSHTKRMSASLKEKLRRLKRYHGPVTPSTPLSSLKPDSLTTVTINTVCDKFDNDGFNQNCLTERTCLSTPVASTSLNTVTVRPQKRLKLSTKFDVNILHPTESELLSSSSLPSKKSSTVETNPRFCTSQQQNSLRPNCTEDDCTDKNDRLRKIREQISNRQELLRKLRLVRLYRDKNDLYKLQSTIDKWRSAFCEAVTELREKSTSEPKPSVAQMLNHLQIDPTLIRYECDDECFY